MDKDRSTIFALDSAEDALRHQGTKWRMLANDEASWGEYSASRGPETDATAVQSVDRTAKEKSCAVDPTEVSIAGHALQQPPRSYKSVRLPWIGLIFMCKAS